MTIDPSKALRWLSLASMVALASVGCAAVQGDAATDDGAGSSTDDITSVDQSKVKRQSIGNCWIYATASWVEALDKAATGQEVNTSESWHTFWHWYEQLANGSVGSEVETGGSYATSAELINRYGLMLEADFIPEEATDEMSMRQSNALDAVNAQLKNGGPLKDAVSHRDRKAVLNELMKAWQLSPEVQANITAVFGADVSKTLDKSYQTTAPGHAVIRAKDFAAELRDPDTKQPVKGTLADAIGQRSSAFGERTGKFAFHTEYYPEDAAGRRAFLKRVQMALHDQQPMMMSWHVDFNALTPDSHFSLDQLKRLGVGRQGGHMTLLHDYEATNVPGFGTLKAGVQATPEQMKAALDDQTQIVFLRVKNSWGGIRPDRWTESSIAGYHDLEMPYLNGPIQECDETEPGVNPTPDMCHGTVVPLGDVTLPAGY